MAERHSRVLSDGAAVHWLFSDSSDGDLAHRRDAADDVAASRRQRLVALPWTCLAQQHSDVVLDVTRAGEHFGESGDGLVSAVPGAVLSVQVADCVPVLLWSTTRTGVVVAAVHAGWRGLVSGILQRAVGLMVRRGAEGGAGSLNWTLGPCISPAAYQFGADDLEGLTDQLGPSIKALTSEGAPALDLRAGVASSLRSAGVVTDPVGTPPACTASSGRHYSHRAHGDDARQVGAIWWERT